MTSSSMILWPEFRDGALLWIAVRRLMQVGMLSIAIWITAVIYFWILWRDNS